MAAATPGRAARLGLVPQRLRVGRTRCWSRWRAGRPPCMLVDRELLRRCTGRSRPGPISDTERALYGPVTTREIGDFLDTWVRGRLGSPIEDIRFRAGRIDVVWGVELKDGRAVVIKTHRPPVDPNVLRATHEAQRMLADAGFPCAAPLAG